MTDSIEGRRLEGVSLSSREYSSVMIWDELLMLGDPKSFFNLDFRRVAFSWLIVSLASLFEGFKSAAVATAAEVFWTLLWCSSCWLVNLINERYHFLKTSSLMKERESQRIFSACQYIFNWRLSKVTPDHMGLTIF